MKAYHVNVARDEFNLASTVQHLQKLAKLMLMSAPKTGLIGNDCLPNTLSTPLSTKSTQSSRSFRPDFMR